MWHPVSRTLQKNFLGMKPFLFFMNFLTTIHKIERYCQSWQLSLIQIETQAISPSKIRPQSEKIAPILTSFIYVIIIINK